MADDSTKQPAMDRVNNGIYAVAAGQFLEEGKLEQAGSLVQYSFANRDSNGNYTVDTLGAMALADFYKFGPQSAIGKRIESDSGKFQTGLEEFDFTEMGASIVGRLGLGKRVLERVLQTAGSIKIKDLNDSLREYKLRRDELTVPYERQIKEAGEDKDKVKKLNEERQEKLEALNKQFEREIKLSNVASEALRISVDRVNTDAMLYGQFSGVKSVKDVAEMVEKAPPAYKVSDLY